MARGGLKPKKPKPTKEATLNDVSDLLKPEVFERLGPVGTMNMLQTLATAAKIPEVTNVPALADEPVVAALAGEPKAQKRVQRKVSETKTGLESPKRREILKAARDIGGSAVLPVPTSVKGALVEEVMKPAAKAIPDSAIQAAIASFLKPKLKPVQLERIGRGNFERYETDEPELDLVSPADISRHSGIPVEDINDFLSRNKLNPGFVLSDIADDAYIYKGYRDDVFDFRDIDDMFSRGRDKRDWGDTPEATAVERYKKENPNVDLANLTDDELEDLYSMLNDALFEHTHGPKLQQLASLIGDKEAEAVRKNLRRRYEDILEDEVIDIRESLHDYLEYEKPYVQEPEPELFKEYVGDPGADGWVSKLGPRRKLHDTYGSHLDSDSDFAFVVSAEDKDQWRNQRASQERKMTLTDWVEINRPELFEKYDEWVRLGGRENYLASGLQNDASFRAYIGKAAVRNFEGETIPVPFAGISHYLKKLAEE